MTRKRKRDKKRRLNVAHVVPATPGQCGMYETVHDLVVAERKLGVNAHVVDPRPYPADLKSPTQAVTAEGKCPNCGAKGKMVVGERQIPVRMKPWAEDRGVCVAPMSFAENSDVIVSHSGLGGAFDKCGAPRIHVAHGRPNSSYRIERKGETPIYSTYRGFGGDGRWKAMVTLWPGYEHYWRLVFPRVERFPPFVDLGFWTDGPAGYGWDDKGGDVNLVIADLWRYDRDPFHVLHAVRLYAEANPGLNVKVHVYGLPKDARGIKCILDCLGDRGLVGEKLPMVPRERLREIYRSADTLLSCQRIATRSIREALACGCPVVADRGNPYTPHVADMEDLPEYAGAIGNAVREHGRDRDGTRETNRSVAEREFDPENTARRFVGLFEELTGRKVAE